MSTATIHFAQTSDFAFIDELILHGEAHRPQPGDTVEFDEDLETTSGEPFPSYSATVVSTGDDTYVLRDLDSGEDYEVSTASVFFRITASPAITGLFESHLRRPTPDGIAFADGLVPPDLVVRLRSTVQRLIDDEPVDYHPGSGTRVRDLVHPSLYPYIEGRSVLKNPVPACKKPENDRFGRPYETSRYQWLPTPFRVAQDGTVTIDEYINNLDRSRHPAAYDDLAALFSTALPLIESVVGYVENTKFDVEGDLPDSVDPEQKPAPPVSLRGRELLVIPKIVEYRLGNGETHEGVWHVEGMSHEHIVATCIYVLDRDETLKGGDLRFKRAYTVEEAGRLLYNIDQIRPEPVECLVEEGTIPVGSIATPEGRLLVFPNSHIHKLSELSVDSGPSGAPEARRRVIVFWLVDPGVTIPSTRDVPIQQTGGLSKEEALAARLELMNERRRHKQTLNVRAVSLCEH